VVYRSIAEGRTVACKYCGIRIEPAKITISPRGEIACATCATAERMAYYSAHGKRTALYSGLAPLVAGIAPFAFVLALTKHEWAYGSVPFYRPLALLTGLAGGVLGIASLRRLLRPPERRALGGLFRWAAMAAVVAAVVGCVTVVCTEPAFGVLTLLFTVIWSSWRDRRARQRHGEL
jgi:hypothetical protein